MEQSKENSAKKDLEKDLAKAKDPKVQAVIREKIQKTGKDVCK